jgi:uncharacterized protein YihD (DUF1040 family)
MRDINRIEPLLNNLKELWLKYPDLRLCQLLAWITYESGWINNDLFYLEDDVIVEQIKKML